MRGRKAMLLLKETSSQPKVQKFLESVSRNSMKTKNVYKIGLSYFQTYLSEKIGSDFTLETLLDELASCRMNIYNILDDFVSYVINKTIDTKISSRSLHVYLTAVRSYLAYYDIDIVPAKFKRKVRIPRLYREDELAIDASDIRKILLSCTNRRLKAYLFVLASGGMRAVEGLAIRNRDLDYSTNPTKVHIRKEYAKTGVARDIYISEEASECVKQWLKWKYRSKTKLGLNPEHPPEDLVFSGRNYRNDQVTPNGIYYKVAHEFQKLLEIVGMDDRKEGLQKRRKITLHTFRRHAKTTISNQVGQDFSEWFLGHSKSPYWTLKEPARREIYATKCMKYLTFLDYSTLEYTGKNIEARLVEKDEEMKFVKEQIKSILSALNILGPDDKALLAKRLIENGMYTTQKSHEWSKRADS
jgi:integrase